MKQQELPNNPEEVKNALSQLIETLGWKIIVENLEKEIQEIQDRLNGKGTNIADMAELKSLQGQRDDRVYLKELPALLIEQSEQVVAGDTDLDPYEKDSTFDRTK